MKLTIPFCIQTLTLILLPGPTADAAAQRTLHQSDIEHVLDLSRTCQQRQALAGRADGLRYCAASMLEAENQFRRVNGHLELPVLRAALKRKIEAQNVSQEYYTEQVT